MVKTNEIKQELMSWVQPGYATYQYGQGADALDLSRQRNGGISAVTPILNNTVYYSRKPGFVVCTALPAQTTSITGYTGNNNPPTTAITSTAYTLPLGSTASPQLITPVKAGEYYKIDSTSGLSTAYFISLA